MGAITAGCLSVLEDASDLSAANPSEACLISSSTGAARSPEPRLGLAAAILVVDGDNLAVDIVPEVGACGVLVRVLPCLATSLFPKVLSSEANALPH